MNPRARSGECYICPPNSQQREDRSLCECILGYYADTLDERMTCATCPPGAVCDRLGMWVERMIAADGWWRADNQSVSFLKCLLAPNCEDGGCAANRQGALCAVCADGFSTQSSGGACQPCPSKEAATGGTIGFSILIVAAVMVVLYLVWRLDGEDVPKTSPFDVVKAYTPEHRARPNYTYNFKILLSYLQISTTLFAFVQVPFPTAFSTFVRYFAFVNLSFIVRALRRHAFRCGSAVTNFDSPRVLVVCGGTGTAVGLCGMCDRVLVL